MRYAVLWVLWDAWVSVKYGAIEQGYRIRPYDLIADRRRWWFQRPARCGFLTRGR